MMGAGSGTGVPGLVSSFFRGRISTGPDRVSWDYSAATSYRLEAIHWNACPRSDPALPRRVAVVSRASDATN